MEKTNEVTLFRRDNI